MRVQDRLSSEDDNPMRTIYPSWAAVRNPFRAKCIFIIFLETGTNKFWFRKLLSKGMGVVSWDRPNVGIQFEAVIHEICAQKFNLCLKNIVAPPSKKTVQRLQHQLRVKTKRSGSTWHEERQGQDILIPCVDPRAEKTNGKWKREASLTCSALIGSELDAEGCFGRSV